MTAQADTAKLNELAAAAGLQISEEQCALLLSLLKVDVSPQGILVFLRAIKDAKHRSALQQQQQRQQP